MMHLDILADAMGLFSTLLTKIIGRAPAAPSVATPPPTSAPPVQPAVSSQTPAPAPLAASDLPPPPVVDVAAVLDGLAKKNPEKLDWKKSIVDLMKLVEMDSSLSARKELAKELDYPGDTGDSAKMNVWLHKEVMKQLATNGGKIPDNLLD